MAAAHKKDALKREKKCFVIEIYKI